MKATIPPEPPSHASRSSFPPPARSAPASSPNPASTSRPASPSAHPPSPRERRPFTRESNRPDRPSFTKPWAEEKADRLAAASKSSNAPEGKEVSPSTPPQYDKRSSGKPAFGRKPAFGNKPSFGRKPSFGDKPGFDEKRQLRPLAALSAQIAATPAPPAANSVDPLLKVPTQATSLPGRRPSPSQEPSAANEKAASPLVLPSAATTKVGRRAANSLLAPLLKAAIPAHRAANSSRVLVEIVHPTVPAPIVRPLATASHLSAALVRHVILARTSLPPRATASSTPHAGTVHHVHSSPDRARASRIQRLRWQIGWLRRQVRRIQG